MDAPKVSVIVLVYNCEDYIARCIQSLLAQTLREIEIIAIDDGSTDKSGAILDRYAEKDQRLRVFHQKNGGVSAARNKGLQYAQGTYIGFVDGDDYVEPDMYQELLAAVDHRAEVAICGYDLQFVGHRETRPCQGAPLIRITSPSDFYMQYFWKSPNLWDKIYCRQMIEQRRVFFSGDVGEDLLFNLELLLHLKTAAIVQKVLYHYVQRKNSIIHRGNWKILRQGDLFENYLVKFCGKASMEEEQSPLLYISFFSVLTGYLCSAKTASRPFGSLKHHIYKLTRDTQLCAICEKAMQSGELYKLRKKCLITPAFYQIEKWLCFLLKHRMVRASSAVIWMISRLYVKSHLEDETTLFA